MKSFETTHLIFNTKFRFDEDKPPKWLYNPTAKGTMDQNWFYKDHVLNLDLGQTIETDFHEIRRIK